MNRLAILSMIVATNVVVSRALPTGCSEDVHCPAGSYCELTQLHCRECLRCEDLKRQPRLIISCITSARDCGQCFEGLVPDDGQNHCISPQMKKDIHLLPYEWTIVSIALLLAVVICVAAIFVLRNFYTFKICTSTQTLVRSSVAADGNEFPASAPLPPPSYNAVAVAPTNQCEASQPLILPFKPQSVIPRHSMESQTARVFNVPAHMRSLPSFSDAEIPADEHDSLPTIEEQSTDVHHGIGSSGNADVSEEGTTANAQPLTLASFSKHLRDRQDTNNNPEEDNVSTASKSGGGGGTAFIINVIRNVNTVQQRNKLAL